MHKEETTKIRDGQSFLKIGMALPRSTHVEEESHIEIGGKNTEKSQV